MKTKKKNRKTKKIFQMILIFAVLVFSLFTFSFLSHAVLNFQGWGWIGNNSEDGGSRIPTVGWLSMMRGQTETSCGGYSGNDYGVTLGGNQGESPRNMLGYGWFGIGSSSDPWSSEGLLGATCQSDGKSLGWANFQAGYPTSFSCPADCHAARWNDMDSDPDNGFAGYLSGWAKIVSMGEDGWIHFNGSNCSNPSNSYCVRFDQDGNMGGYAWNSGNPTREGGLGWIKFDDMEVCLIGFPSSTITLSENAENIQLTKNTATAMGIPFDLAVTQNPTRLHFPGGSSTYSGTFPSSNTSYDVPIEITPFSGGTCFDTSKMQVSSVCGQSEATIYTQKTCTVECSPDEFSIMPGESQVFTGESPEFPAGTLSWSVSNDPDGCVESVVTSADEKTYTVKSRLTSPITGEPCFMKSIRVTVSNCCASDTCQLNISRTGWVETNPN